MEELAPALLQTLDWSRAKPTLGVSEEPSYNFFRLFRLCFCGLLFTPTPELSIPNNRCVAILLELSVGFANVAFCTKDSRQKPCNVTLVAARCLTMAYTQLVQGF